MSDIKLKLRSFLNTYFEDCEINDDDNIFEIGHISSLFAMQLVLFLEKEYKIKAHSYGALLLSCLFYALTDAFC